MAYFPTNPGWGAAATYAKKKNPAAPPAPPGNAAFWQTVGKATAAMMPAAPAGGWAQHFVPGLGAPQPTQSNPYAGLIGGMPDLSGLESQFKAQSADDAAARDAALRRLVISYGGAPDFASMGISDKALGFLKGAIDQKTKDLAAKADAEGLSVRARQADANNIANRKIPALLAGRGLLRSGQTGYDLSEQAKGYKIQQYDTLNELLSNVEGTVGSFLQAERERQMALAQARMQAAWDAFNSWGSYPVGGGQGPTYTSSGPTGPQPISYHVPTGPGNQGSPYDIVYSGWGEATANKQAKQYLATKKNNKPGTPGFRPF